MTEMHLQIRGREANSVSAFCAEYRTFTFSGITRASVYPSDYCPDPATTVESVSISTVFRPSNNIHSNAKRSISIPMLSRGYCDRLVDKKLFAENSELNCKRLFMFSVWRLFAGEVEISPIKHMSYCRSLAPFPKRGTTRESFGDSRYHFLEREVVVARAISENSSCSTGNRNACEMSIKLASKFFRNWKKSLILCPVSLFASLHTLTDSCIM
jgi:hypothetical protein